jgi:two-component system, response regulator, stage 0 sporulation protein F
MVMSTILVVENEESFQVFYQKDLELEGHVVIIAGDAAKGLRVLDSQSPDLVVLDVRMLGMNGLDAMGRKLDRDPRIPIVLNSGYSSYKFTFLSWAADAYVIKSSDTGELRAKIRELLDRSCESGGRLDAA